MDMERIAEIAKNLDPANRLDITVGIETRMSNPNGDPQRDNKPRVVPDGRGHITKGCFNNKMRLALAKVFDQPIFTYRYQTKKEGIEEYMEKVRDTDMELIESMARSFIDLRLFGSTMTYKGANSGDVHSLRGPVQATEGLSIDPIEIKRIDITSQQVSNEDQAGNGTFGDKYVVLHGLYEFVVSYNPYSVYKEGIVTQDDLRMLLQSMSCFGRVDQTANRNLETSYMVIAEHPDALGKNVSNVSGRSVLDVQKNKAGKYEWELKDSLPDNVKFHLID